VFGAWSLMFSTPARAFAPANSAVDTKSPFATLAPQFLRKLPNKNCRLLAGLIYG
jgi:hypothetical protein